MYTFSIIDNNLQQLEGLQYITTLDLNKGYYLIRIFPASQDTMIVTEFGKFRYICLPIGILDQIDIFQEKIYKILGWYQGS